MISLYYPFLPQTEILKSTSSKKIYGICTQVMRLEALALAREKVEMFLTTEPLFISFHFLI